MRIWIDVREACRERKTGKGQWTLRCVDALLRRGDVEATLLTDAPIPDAWRGLPGLKGVREIPNTGIRWHVRAAALLRRERATIDRYLSPTSYIVPFLVGEAVPVVPVVHDLIAFRNEPHDRKAKFIERMTLPRALRAAFAVCCVSESTAREVGKMFGALPLRTVGAGPTTADDGTWNGSGDFILCVGTLCPRKNQLRLIEAFASLPSSVRGDTGLLLVGGRGWDDDAIVRAAAETDRVEWMGFQDDATVARLLRECRAFAYVSEEEGFGLPILDALRVGAPVLTSDIPASREVAGDAATYADPLDVGSIAKGLAAVLGGNDPAKRAAGRVRAAAFSWEKTAEAVVSACSGVDNRA